MHLHADCAHLSHRRSEVAMSEDTTVADTFTRRLVAYPVSGLVFLAAVVRLLAAAASAVCAFTAYLALSSQGHLTVLPGSPAQDHRESHQGHPLPYARALISYLR